MSHLIVRSNLYFENCHFGVFISCYCLIYLAITACGADIFILVDASGSVGRNTFNDVVVPFSEALVEKIEERFGQISDDTVRVGVITFSAQELLRLDLVAGNTRMAVDEKLQSMRFGDSWTHMVQTIQEAKRQLAASQRNVEKHLIVITDGLPESNVNIATETTENFINEILTFASADSTHSVSVVGVEGTGRTFRIENLENTMQRLEVSVPTAGRFRLNDMTNINTLATSVSAQVGTICDSKYNS